MNRSGSRGTRRPLRRGYSGIHSKRYCEPNNFDASFRTFSNGQEVNRGGRPVRFSNEQSMNRNIETMANSYTNNQILSFDDNYQENLEFSSVPASSTQPYFQQSNHSSNSEISNSNPHAMMNYIESTSVRRDEENDSNFSIRNAASNKANVNDFFEVKEKFDQMLRAKKPSELILEYRNCIDKLAQKSVERNLQAIEQISLWKSQDSGKEIFQMQEDNFNLQRNEFENFVTQVKQQLSALSTSESYQIIQKADTIINSVKNECKIFDRFLPGYSIKSKVISQLKQNQVLIVLSDSLYFLNVVLPILLSKQYPNNMILCCEDLKIQSSSLKTNVLTFITNTSKENNEIEFLCAEDMLEFVTKNMLQDKCEKDCIVICRVPLKRSIIFDLLLANLRDVLEDHFEYKLILLLSSIDNSLKYESYFSDYEVDLIKTPPLSFPVTTVWKNEPLLPTDNYIEEVVKTAVSIHILKDDGDIMVFLPTLSDAKSALVVLKRTLYELRDNNVECLIIHDGSPNSDWLRMSFQKPNSKRTIFFVTDCAESFVISSVCYVIDSGLKKEKIFDSTRKIDVLTTTFISCDKAKFRKKIAGCYNDGICYRLYSKENFCKEMPANEYPEIININPFNAMLKLFQYQPSNALNVELVESLPDETKKRTINLLKRANAIKDNKLTFLGQQIIKLNLPPLYAKFILIGIEWELGYETVILVSFFSVKGRVFQFHNDADSQRRVDAAKLQLIKSDSDTLSYIYIYKLWLENKDDKTWCSKYCLNEDTLKQVHLKITEIIEHIGDSIKQSIIPVFNSSKDNNSLLLELLFDCFQRHLCVFTGHYKSGYRMLSSRTIAFLHPSSIICQTENLPQFIIFDHMISTKRDFLVHITTIPTDMIMNALTNQTLNFDYSDMFENTLEEKIIEPVGERIIKQVFLGKKGFKLKDIERKIRFQLSDESVIIEPSPEKGRISVFASKNSIDNAAKAVNEILKKEFESILNSEETRTFNLKKGPVNVPGEIKWLNGCKFKTLKTSVPSDLQAQTNVQENNQFENIPYVVRQSINLTWIRRKCTGRAIVKFHSQYYPLARRFALKQVPILGVDVFITSAEKEPSLILSGLPNCATVSEVENDIKKIFLDVKFKRVELEYEPPFETTDAQVQEIKTVLENTCLENTELVDFDIIIPQPKNTATIMKAFINVSNDENIVVASKVLSKNLQSFMGIVCRPVYSSVIKSSLRICEVLKSCFQDKLSELEELIMEKFPDSDLFQFHIAPVDRMDDLSSIKMTSNNPEILDALQRTVYSLLEGDIINKNFNKDIGKLFCHGGFLWLKTLEDDDCHLVTDYRNKSIRVYGSKEKCHSIKKRILQFLLDSESEAVKNIPLHTENNNRILLKALIIEYGVNLENFISLCELRSAVLNIKACSLSLHGSRESIEKAEILLKKLASQIDLSSFSQVLEDVEYCPVCACPALHLTYRLEICGHLYCCECIEGLIEQAQFPIQCCSEECNKDIILDDICKIMGDDSEKIDALLEKSMKKYLEEHHNIFVYCPAPDCSMFFDKNEIKLSKHQCPLCQNEICTKCNVVYHQGYSCDMYQGSKSDPDYSFKIWQENSTECKQCPKCKTAIQKNGGCDHMTCGSCSSHFCWVCVQEFPSARKVYEHIPFCTKYPRF